MSDTIRPLALVDDEAPEAAPPNRGRLLTVEDIARDLYRGNRSRWWVRHRFAPEARMHHGRLVVWWEADALAWIDSHRATPREAVG